MPFVVSLRGDTGLCIHGACTNSIRKYIGISCVLFMGISMGVVLLQPQPSHPVTAWRQRSRKLSGELRLAWGDQRMEAGGTLNKWY